MCIGCYIFFGLWSIVSKFVPLSHKVTSGHLLNTVNNQNCITAALLLLRNVYGRYPGAAKCRPGFVYAVSSLICVIIILYTLWPSDLLHYWIPGDDNICLTTAAHVSFSMPVSSTFSLDSCAGCKTRVCGSLIVPGLDVYVLSSELLWCPVLRHHLHFCLGACSLSCTKLGITLKSTDKQLQLLDSTFQCDAELCTR